MDFFTPLSTVDLKNFEVRAFTVWITLIVRVSRCRRRNDLIPRKGIETGIAEC